VADTANELFRDALLRRQIALAHFERGLQTDIVRVLDETERDLRVAMADRLMAVEGKAFGTTTNSRLNVMANALAKIRSSAFDEVSSMWDDSLEQLALDEAEFLDRNLKRVSPVMLDTLLPDPVMLAAIVSVEPMGGRVLSEWASTSQRADLQRIMDAVRVGMTQGESTDDIIRRVVGSRDLNGTDGVLEISRRDAAAITQTAVSTVANSARGEYYAANDDIFDTESWVATLDSKTCEECGSLDGQQFPNGTGPKAPLHFNCRCTRVATINGRAIGNRPATSATEEALAGLTGKDRRARVQEMTGQVPATTTYPEWLGRQSESFQEHVLGTSRAALFRDGGLTLDKFVNRDGKTLNLDQLRTREPEAFERSGI